MHTLAITHTHTYAQITHQHTRNNTRTYIYTNKLLLLRLPPPLLLLLLLQHHTHTPYLIMSMWAEPSPAIFNFAFIFCDAVMHHHVGLQRTSPGETVVTKRADVLFQSCYTHQEQRLEQQLISLLCFLLAGYCKCPWYAFSCFSSLHAILYRRRKQGDNRKRWKGGWWGM